MEKDLKKYWCYDIKMKWIQVEKPRSESSLDISNFLEDQDYLLQPDMCLGDELNFLSVYDHPFKEEYLIHLVLDDLAKVLYANSLPAMLELLAQLNGIMNSYFKTLINVEMLKDGDECSGLEN